MSANPKSLQELDPLEIAADKVIAAATATFVRQFAH
jgi:hypothetical protein